MTPIETEVLICGSGSAGLCAGLWLARLGIDYQIIEKRDGPLVIGQADGVQCRTVEVFESFNLDSDLVKNAYWVNEVCFWSPNNTSDSSGERISRSKITPDVMPGISHKPHVIMNQAYLNMLLTDDMKRYSGTPISYGVSVKAIKDIDIGQTYPVTVMAEKDGEVQEYRAKYVLGCDGAHSTVRKSLGYQMVGDTSDAVWGVMDIFLDTDFPDIRKKVIIRSKAGNMLIIPREGDHMVRFYLELPHGTVAKQVKLEDLQATATAILSQYKLHIKHTFWWSAYAIGQRLADHFSKDNRIFLTGDACHTHSPKAGQGMNLSLQDGYNIGWKLAAVLQGYASEDLLRTYNLEREKTAKDLIAFDREFTELFSSNADSQSKDAAKVFSEYFIKSGKYTAGLTTRYGDSMITNSHGSRQDLARNVTVGMRLPSAQVVRLSDAKAVQLGKVLQCTGQWRVVVLAGDIGDTGAYQAMQKFADHWGQSGISPKLVECLLILDQDRLALDDAVIEGQISIPAIFTPKEGEYKLSFHHKILIDEESYNSGHGQAYKTLGVDSRQGAVIVVRPDQHVAMVTSLEDVAGVQKFFGIFLTGKSSL
ncbi:phenol 2-monooxygenase [Microthyrium microscopicum]|uniref:Phenol 2-monooxygenase n=1 Tax=Microthyrium microscopicum TaxID=703497 RepID=A0A6A6UHT3_9PEZI|nr:phenol 2-monooxygenase [Microthyrium microscopicum]